ncbi:uncharacterized protein E0L32_005878 [Thyridium curvatum]|uniref:SnoaL-like domain-containing protein n=1 Tax=Thyridium curvatum TaxID=1093900 RepID=A0A507ASA3_9PEZI|nr:uncharacterized protein E0L32_005878 [Thyridium curvatum]TPX13675.1 hypothetical protein E0L32_005878 [Thyridium curvatum]
MENWKTENDFTTIEALHKDLPFAPSKYHDPSLVSVEQEILEFFKGFGHFLNVGCRTDISAGKDFFEMKDYSIFDIMGILYRPNLEPHYDHITPYLGHTNQKFRDVEIVAVTPSFGYITAVQRVEGTAADGAPYNITYRTTSLVRKVDGGKWKYVHEHYSFPVNMATKVADTTCTQKLSDSVAFQ